MSFFIPLDGVYIDPADLDGSDHGPRVWLHRHSKRSGRRQSVAKQQRPGSDPYEDTGSRNSTLIHGQSGQLQTWTSWGRSEICFARRTYLPPLLPVLSI